MLKREEMPVCDVATTVQVLDSKWKLLIIRDLMTGPKRPAQLLKSLAGLSQKVLTASLKSMISDGIVEKIDYNTMPPHVEYRLSPLGESLRPVIEAMRRWGEYYKSQLEEQPQPSNRPLSSTAGVSLSP